jgi:hypothetical protein
VCSDQFCSTRRHVFWCSSHHVSHHDEPYSPCHEPPKVNGSAILEGPGAPSSDLLIVDRTQAGVEAGGSGRAATHPAMRRGVARFSMRGVVA